ncbi:GDSL-type esterase/lipase family protein [Spongiactinospora sp. TRM90649]|uniref:GDSL-type esterase/lipase family protein n=1 Tax=Spongiactinospora sp. TRM90649 TaxID=3031114 RepID=UPI0023FA4488|nr:GDSL-type esterase/lipase family protein [Spongiactinospora sp. TRM90649]MDF5751735.1 GDSL-type esterase/lipase family protein [Spongiactinospora sp. TRM90649]
MARSRTPLSRRWLRTVVALLAAVPVAAQPAAHAAPTPPAQPAPPPKSSPTAPAPRADTVDPKVRDQVLGTGWRASKDLAWTVAGDPTGLHLLVAESRTGYTWRTAASLSEPGYETDRWVGNACLTGSGRRAVVVYAPRQFTNREQLFQRGAFAAVVDLTDGKIRRLDTRFSLAYHDPGCGTGEQAVLSQAGGQALGATRLHVIDTTSGKTLRRHEVPGQITSAVPVGDRIVASGGDGLIRIDRDGRSAAPTRVGGLPYSLRPDAEGGVSFLRTEGKGMAVAEHLAAGDGAPREFARGPLTKLGLTRGVGGRAFLTGSPERVGALPAQVTRVAAGVREELSTEGRLAVTHDGSRTAASVPAQGRPVTLRARVIATGANTGFGVVAGGPTGAADGVKADGVAKDGVAEDGSAENRASLAGSPSDPVEAERTCAIARNDPRRQATQPHWRQVEWAANLAVQNALTIQRPANWHGSGLSAWSPQGLFPPLTLKGGGKVPAQIMLGILAQESNLWQASYHALEGVTGSPLIGDYYGARGSADGWTVQWGDSDCGYGVAQVTDGMRVGQIAETKQRAVALDYATNIAAGLRILQEKWNSVYDYLKINNADPARPENWFAAVWAYNSGVQPDARNGNTNNCTPSPTCTDADGNWGLGWTNNPINPDYPADREPFLETSQSDARNPQWWPYPEKVIGWAAYPIVKTDWRDDSYQAGYLQSWWTTNENRYNAKPPRELFCDASNRCDASKSEPCQSRPALKWHCWWHKPAVWKTDCATSCGYPAVRFAPGAAEPAFGSGGLMTEHYPPNCNPFSTTRGLPVNSLIIDDVPDSVPSVRPNCSRNWTNKGTFSLDFAQDQAGAYRSKIDFHQIGGGMGGHFWFTHTQPQANSAHRITGSWKLNQALRGWARVLVHLPDQGAHTQQASYMVDLGDGTPPRKRVVQQRAQEHRWVSLGAFKFNGTPKVSLSNITEDGEWAEDIAWDAIAFQPLPAKPKHMVVALGDSYTSGEGASNDARFDYYQETDDDGGGVKGTYQDDEYTWKYGNACHRSKYAWPRLVKAADSGAALGSRHDALDVNVDLQFHACSGAQTENILGAGDPHNAFGNRNHGQYREPSQLDKGYLDENTTLVMLSVGGNDSRFGPVLTECISDLVNEDCPDVTLQGDDLPLRQKQPQLITNLVKPSLVTVLREIKRRAPNARIALMGYPFLFEDNGDCVIGLDPDTEGPWLNSVSTHLANEMDAAVDQANAEGINATFVDPFPEFQGKAVCGNPESIHGVILARTQGESESFLPSQQSFHPKIAGTILYAAALNRVLGPIGSR